ncbi:14582_t:CDS:2, partial [Cetraspora pellucida]
VLLQESISAIFRIQGSRSQLKEEYEIKERECIYLLENILTDPEEGKEGAYIIGEHFEIEAEERFLTTTMDEHTTKNRWYEEEEVEAFLATIWDELEIDKKLNGKEPITNSDTDDGQFDLYDDKRYVGEPYEKEVRYIMILESIVLEPRELDLVSIDDKRDEDPCPIDKNEEKEHIQCAKEELNRIHDSNPPEDVCSKGTMTTKINH